MMKKLTNKNYQTLLNKQFVKINYFYFLFIHILIQNLFRNNTDCQVHMNSYTYISKKSDSEKGYIIRFEKYTMIY
jgi:hypothetical protein